MSRHRSLLSGRVRACVRTRPSFRGRMWHSGRKWRVAVCAGRDRQPDPPFVHPRGGGCPCRRVDDPDSRPCGSPLYFLCVCVLCPRVWWMWGQGPSGVGGPCFCGGVRRCPTLPPSLVGSTIGAGGLSFRVRNGSGRFPFAVAAVTFVWDLLLGVWWCGVVVGVFVLWGVRSGRVWCVGCGVCGKSSAY